MQRYSIWNFLLVQDGSNTESNTYKYNAYLFYKVLQQKQ